MDFCSYTSALRTAGISGRWIAQKWLSWNLKNLIVLSMDCQCIRRSDHPLQERSDEGVENSVIWSEITAFSRKTCGKVDFLTRVFDFYISSSLNKTIADCENEHHLCRTKRPRCVYQLPGKMWWFFLVKLSWYDSIFWRIYKKHQLWFYSNLRSTFKFWLGTILILHTSMQLHFLFLVKP